MSVVVEGVEIPERLIAEEIQNHPQASAAEARAAAARALAVKALLLARAAELGLQPEPETSDGRQETDEEALIRAVLDAEVEPAAPSEAECRRVYEARPDRFCSPALYEASHVLFEPEGDEPDAWAAAHGAACRALDELLETPSAFADLARELSDCPSGQVGGSLGQLRPGELAAEVEVALDALEPGQIARAPVRSRFGWHLLRLDRRAPAGRLPFEAVREKIRMHLESRAWVAAASHYVASLAERARSEGVSLALQSDGTLERPAITLGALLGEEGAADRLGPWLQAVDPQLAARVAAAAQRQGVCEAEFVRACAHDFMQNADDEGWTRLVSAARDAADPALASLAWILKSKLAPPRRNITLIKRV
jgi:peptidyl-prolyl cis-trans isomerase C